LELEDFVGAKFYGPHNLVDYCSVNWLFLLLPKENISCLPRMLRSCQLVWISP